MALKRRDTVTGKESSLAITGLLVAIGHEPRSHLVRGQVGLDADGYVVTKGRSSYTNLPGVFAADDLVDRTYRQAITAAGSGSAAAIDTQRWLADNAQVHTAHATAAPVSRHYATTPAN